ncbi:unnamed protein product [Malus baccata var. baccata]
MIKNAPIRYQDDSNIRLVGVEGSRKKEKTGTPLVDLAYQRAKSVKAAKKATDGGKIVRKSNKKSSRPPRKTQPRTEEMQDVFQSDMSQRRQNRKSSGVGK